MGRPHIEFIQAYDIAPELVDAGALAGARRRILSADDSDTSYTSLLTLSAPFRAELADLARPLELFMLSGAASIGGVSFTPGCYAYVPGGRSTAVIEAETDAELLLMVEPAAPPEPESDDPLQVLDVNAMPWDAVRTWLGDRPERAEGIVVKVLRVKPDGDGWTWVASNVIDWTAGYAEVHPTVEEAFMLRGDCLLGTCGVMGPGSYFYRPPMVPHGPMYTRSGGFFFFRTRGGGLRTDYVAVPGWEQLVEEYRSSAPFFEPPLAASAAAQ
jgi:hypothetical protein